MTPYRAVEKNSVSNGGSNPTIQKSQQGDLIYQRHSFPLTLLFQHHKGAIRFANIIVMQEYARKRFHEYM